MKLEQQLQYLGRNYKIIASENEYIVHPAALGYVSIEVGALQLPFSCSYQVTEYKLQLNNLSIETSDKAILPMEASPEESYEFGQMYIPYTGALLIADGLLEEYRQEDSDTDDNLPIFSYKTVYELVFNNGNLITTVDQSKAMQRIRKNLELGLRRMDNKRDYQCIRRFIKSNLIGDYRPFSSQNKKLRYLENMKKAYRDTFSPSKA